MITDIYEKAKELAKEKWDLQASIDWEYDSSEEAIRESERLRNEEYEKDLKEIEDFRLESLED